jgi:hypothetical protein
MYESFYRTRPASANITLLALEWANFPLSVGFVFLRMIKLILAGAVFIGRIDTPFLAPRVGSVGGLELDNYPTIFLKSILAQEAHRHPYIELLGVMYLMKLRHRGDFGNRAGSSWRLIFAFALMPWMHKHRIHADQETEVPLASIRNVGMRTLSWTKNLQGGGGEEGQDLGSKLDVTTAEEKSDEGESQEE